jgi:hypothetical protein
VLDYITANLPLFANLDRKLVVKIDDIGEVNFQRANFLINGEALNSLKKLPDSLVQTVITSPPQGRNKRTVWEVPLSKFRDAHFAVFPEQ